jgi:two-component system, LytTR family, sensor kinase
MLSGQKKLLEIMLHLVFWGGVFLVLTSLNSSHIHVWAKTRHVVHDQYEDTSISSYVYVILVFLAVLFYGNIFWIFRKAIQYKNVIVRLLICAGWFLVVFGANYFAVGPQFDQTNQAIEPPPPVNVFQKHYLIKDDTIMKLPHPDHPDPLRVGVINFMINDWQHLQPVILLAFLMIMGISIAYFFLKEWAKSELIQTQLQAYQFSTELKFLKSQINPHFLFNTLNNLFSMAQAKGNDELADGISKLSGMMRYMLYDSNAESVSLSTEISYLEECITLNKLRYADEEAMVKFNYPSHTTGISIPPMLFIPFVENAFKHGVAIGQATTIGISIVVSEQNLIFICENAKYSMIKKMDIEKSGIGLENVKRRLELLYPGKHQLKITETDEKYMVNLEINLV